MWKVNGENQNNFAVRWFANAVLWFRSMKSVQIHRTIDFVLMTFLSGIKKSEFNEPNEIRSRQVDRDNKTKRLSSQTATNVSKENEVGS